MNAKAFKTDSGFTFIEAIIGMLIVSLLMTTAYKVFSYVVLQRNRGSVDLQELQGARQAINFLRRDFRSAAPLILPTANHAQKKVALKRPVIEATSFNKENDTVPIVIADSEIHFFKHAYKTDELKASPETEQVNYRIDTTRKCLVRSSAGVEKVFSDIKDAKFELYAHPLLANVPMLLVTLRIDANKNDQGAGRNYFELTTTISSSITNQNLNHPNWNQTTY